MIMEKIGYKVGYNIGSMLHKSIDKLFQLLGQTIYGIWEVVVFLFWAVALISGIIAAIIFLCTLHPIPFFWVAMIWCAYEMGKSERK